MLAAFVLLAGGCGGGTGAATAPDPVFAPAISAQPANASVPMGIAAIFSVSATGPSLQYQWMRNGSEIPAATSSTYQTPPTTFADSGASFSVMVSNPNGSKTSDSALLSVTARAPQAGDLRFQQVDASGTVNGYGGGGISTNMLPRTASDYSPAVGTPFYVGASDCATPPTVGACSWSYTALQAAASGPLVGYANDDYANFSQDLGGPSAWMVFANGIQPLSPQSVITSLDLEPASALFAVAWVQQPSPGAFDLAVRTVAPADFPAAATQEGAAGRVITAVSADSSGQLTYLSYGWQQDTTTVYEAAVVTASPADAPAAATNLAAAGYIITASGQADANSDVVFVGTRVQGDTLPRPFVADQGSVQGVSLQQQGYVIVAVVVNLADTTDPYAFLYER